MRTSLMRRRFLAIPTLCEALLSVSCSEKSEWDSAAIDQGSRRWVSVYRGADFRVFIDTANIHAQFYKLHRVWSRTDHRVPHLRKGKRWNREVSESLILAVNASTRSSAQICR